MNLVLPKKRFHCGQRNMCSWGMVNNEENWLPWQIKHWFNKNLKKSPKGTQSLGLVTFQVPSPQRVNICQGNRPASAVSGKNDLMLCQVKKVSCCVRAKEHHVMSRQKDPMLCQGNRESCCVRVKWFLCQGKWDSCYVRAKRPHVVSGQNCLILS